MLHETGTYNRESLAYDSFEQRSPAQIYVIHPEKTHKIYLFLKRLIDIALSVLGLILSSPLILAVAVAIKLDDGGPVIYSQIRAGKGGKRFRFYKFRSMCVNAEEKQQNLKILNESDGPVFKLTNDPRVTKVGKILRKSSVDELPQLINVIRGEMAIVGPRPPLLQKSLQGFGVF